MVPKKRLLSIINPISGTHSKIKVPDRIGAVIDESLYDIEIVFTEYAGHATLLAQKAADDKIDCVLSVGGDGTCNEVAKGLIHSDTVLGIVPMGSGNGLARHLDIPIENFRKKLYCQWPDIERCKRTNNSNIDFSVLHTGMRGYICIIPILRRITACNQEGFFLY